MAVSHGFGPCIHEGKHDGLWIRVTVDLLWHRTLLGSNWLVGQSHRICTKVPRCGVILGKLDLCHLVSFI